MIELKNISKSYDGKTNAIEDINLKINDGEIYGIIGLSGAGKSTLVRCINLLEKPTSGEVLIDNVNIETLSKRDLLKMRSNIGMIFQNFNLLSQSNVLKNIMFPLKLAHVDSKVAEERAKELLKLVGLEDKAKAYPSQLSGGQKQRVAIARALASNPKYLLCDEATSALDPETTDSILKLLYNINKEYKVTIIIISHDMAVIRSICDKVAVLDKSRIVEEGDADEIFAHPKSEIAQRFINLRRLEDR